MAVLEMTLPVQRRSALRLPRRDVVLSGGEAWDLRLSLVEADVPEAARLSFANGVPPLRLAVFRTADGGDADYAAPGAVAPALVWQGWGAAIPGDASRMRLLAPGTVTAGWHGAYAYAVQLARDGGAAALLRGTLLVRHGLAMQVVLDPLQDDAGTPVMDDATLAIQVPHAPFG